MGEQSVPKRLLEILACPACEERPRVELHQGGVRCPRCGRIYPVENGIPIMLVERADEGQRGGDGQ